MKSIYVNNKDLGFFTAEPITVQRFERVDGELELVYCNHAGAYEEEVETTTINPNGADWVTYDTLMVCDRCGAQKGNWETYWDGCPEEGLYHE